MQKVLLCFVGFSKPRDIFLWNYLIFLFAFDWNCFAFSFRPLTIASIQPIPCVAAGFSPPPTAVPAGPPRPALRAVAPPCPCPCRCQLRCPARSSARHVNRKPRPVYSATCAPRPRLPPTRPFPPVRPSIHPSPSDPPFRRPEPGVHAAPPWGPALSPTVPCSRGPSVPAVVRPHPWHCFVVGFETTSSSRGGGRREKQNRGHLLAPNLPLIRSVVASIAKRGGPVGFGACMTSGPMILICTAACTYTQLHSGPSHIFVCLFVPWHRQ